MSLCSLLIVTESLCILQVVSDKETDVTLKFEEIFERHYQLKFDLFADSDFGENKTTLELVDESKC